MNEKYHLDLGLGLNDTFLKSFYSLAVRRGTLRFFHDCFIVRLLKCPDDQDKQPHLSSFLTCAFANLAIFFVFTRHPIMPEVDV